MHIYTTSQRKFLDKIRHARYIDGDVPYHIMSKTLRGEFFLHPNPKVNRILAGVVGRAQKRWDKIRLYAYAFMSNHFHLLLQGDAKEVSSFVGFVKREASRRIGQLYNSRGTMWHKRFSSTAVPTAQSQLDCFRYILSQSVKEGLVGRPQSWPGLHCAKQLLTGRSPEGAWFRGTAYGKEKARPNRKKKLRRADYYVPESIELSPLPAWKNKDAKECYRKTLELIESIIEQAAKERKMTGRKLLGVKRIQKTKPTERKEPEVPPWYEDRRRCLVAWASPRNRKVRAYLDSYWAFQKAFSEASEAFRNGNNDAAFPKGSARPSTWAH